MSHPDSARGPDEPTRADDRAARLAAQAPASGPGKDAELTRRINEEHYACERAARTALEHAIRAGELLIEAQGRVGWGGWMRWLRANFEGSKSTSENYMKLARNKEYLVKASSQRVGNLSMRSALALLVPPREPDDTTSDENGGRSPAGASGGATKPRSQGRSHVVDKPGPAAGPGTQPDAVLYRAGDLPAPADALAAALGYGTAVALSCDVPADPAAEGEDALQKAGSFVEAAARAAGSEHCDAHLLVLCASDPAVRDAVEQALTLVPPPDPDDPFAEDHGPNDEDSPADRRRERYERSTLREVEEGVGVSLHRAVLDAGGIRPHKGDLKEEYQQVPLCYRRRDGRPGDEVADYLAANHPEFGIRDESGLMAALFRRRRAA